MAPNKLSGKRALLVLAGVATIGLIDSVYLTLEHYKLAALGCTLIRGCAKVLTSPYAMVGPIPLAVIGVGYYLIVIGLAIYVLFSKASSRIGLHTLLVLAASGAFMSVVFEGTQFFLIHAFCEYCALSALCTFVLLGCAVSIYRTNEVK